MSSHTEAADMFFRTKSLTNSSAGSFVPPKIFAQPFRLALKKGDTDDVTWLEVRSLEGLRNVFAKLDAGELTEIDRFSSVEMQLWGLMAEHAGFMRIKGSASSFAAGIQPLGEQTAALADDLSMFTGGDEIAALGVLDSMKETLKQRPLDQTPMEQVEVTHEFIKEDGVNLTQEGEDALISLVLGGGQKVGNKELPRTKEAIKFEKDRDNAMQLFLETPTPTEEERLAETAALAECVDRPEDMTASDICKENAKPPTEEPKVVGGEAARVGQLIAQAARGLDNKDDQEVREVAEAALDILHTMIEGGYRLDKESFDDVMKKHDVSMEEWVRLAEIGQKIERSYPRANEKSKLDPTEARKNQESNLKKLVEGLDEAALLKIIGDSQVESMTPEERQQHLAAMEEKNRLDRTPYGGDKTMQEFRSALVDGAKANPNLTISDTGPHGAEHYKPREVTPADPEPRGADVMAEKMREQQRRGPASMDTYRKESQRQDPTYGSAEDHKSNDSESPDTQA